MPQIPLDGWQGLVVGLVLALFGVPLVARLTARLDDDPRIYRLLVWSGVLKLLCAPLFIYVINHFYGGIADAYTYNHWGAITASHILHGDLTYHVVKMLGDGGTELVTGYLFIPIGSSELGGFFVFAFLSFVSLVLFYRAFRIALPGGDARRYAWLVLFFPSLLFWTSAIGKDALISLGLGLAALGGARMLARRPGGIVLVAAGLGLTVLVRPHVGLMLFAGLALAYPFSRSKRRSLLGPLSKVVQIAILVAGGFLLAKLTAHFFGLKSLSLSSIHHVLRQNAINTGTAAKSQLGAFGSSTSASTSLSPLALPKDFYDTMLRPLPFQAHGITQLMSSLENTAILAIICVSWRRIANAFRALLAQPYLLTALIYSLVWFLLFASIGNLGILARERTSVLPLFFVLLAWPAHRRAESSAAAAAAATEPVSDPPHQLVPAGVPG